MTIQQAIEKAIEGGWDKWQYFGTDLSARMPDNATDQEIETWLLSDKHMFLDPTFWQSLGKAMGWYFSGLAPRHCRHYYGEELVDENCGNCKATKTPDWITQWHHFIDHLVEGGTPESFFKSLSK